MTLYQRLRLGAIGESNETISMHSWKRGKIFTRRMRSSSVSPPLCAREQNLFRFVMSNQGTRRDIKTGQGKISKELAIDLTTFFLTPIAYKPFAPEPDTLLWKG